uniref:Sperm-tail PG-rich repeat containing 4 n=1 Tax=Molossus molossus TaxID=27622 RepID=A0A7J8E5A0_MOLMO|nr:sperm-tail PG-rich repeat containing 4 [Molossus molossus]
MDHPDTAIISITKPTRKTSSFEREGWWRTALTSVKLSPGQYNLLPAPVPKYASRSFVFCSTVQRFPTACFIPHEGPGPGHYDLKIPPAISVTSCFQSRVPRFLPACSKTPGPGAYTSSAQFPKLPRTIAKMGREHSLFFNNTIGF